MPSPLIGILTRPGAIAKPESCFPCNQVGVPPSPGVPTDAPPPERTLSDKPKTAA